MSKMHGSKLRDMIAHRGFWCPGCDTCHVVRVAEPSPWGFNGDGDKPTFTPSVLVRYPGEDAGQNGAPPAICHSFVIDGRIQFLGDCTHALAGQTVDLPDFPADFHTSP
jgi:hypothetical protein